MLRVTGYHLVYTGSWRPMWEIGAHLAGTRSIVEMTATDVLTGALSHNIKMNQPEMPSQP